MASTGGPLTVEVLGPLRVLGGDGRDLTPGGPLLRRLLALLVLRRGHAVPVDVVIDALWPEGLPADPTAALQNHVSRLRRALPGSPVESVAGGYRLDAGALRVDADQLAAVLDASPLDGGSAAAIEAVLARWHGPAYPELDDLDEARAEAQRLAELRVRAREALAEARLAGGDTDRAVAELRALGRAEPLRERPAALLMEALAATGRHAEALRVYDNFRRRLGDELGIDPSPALAARHRELLDGSGPAAVPAGTRLPVPPTSLIGRDRLAAEVVALAERERLVTLVGPGGVGKTRLLVEVGHRLAAHRPDRAVVWCELAGAEADSAVDVVAGALRIDARPGVPLVTRLADVLDDAEVVILLDNCEHVLDPVAALVDHLGSRCPRVRIVATSRERLRLRGEHVQPVPTLAADHAGSPGVQLFVERARAVDARFEPDPEVLEGIAGIVAGLDGLPLAIELAAARLHTHAVSELSAGLERRFSLLSTGYRSSERHGSLDAAVSWSYRLLDQDLQRTFAELSVFGGAFDAPAAAAVAGLEQEAATERLAQLVERSLVMRAPEGRYLLLETLRAYGGERLAEDGRVGTVAARHAHHLVGWAAAAQDRLDRFGRTVLAEIDAAVPELRRALGWLVDHGEVEAAGRLVASLHDFAFLRLRPDVLAWAERVAEADPADESPFAPLVLASAAYAAWMAGDATETGLRARRAMAAAQRQGRVPPLVMVVTANHHLIEGRVEESASWFGCAADAAEGERPGYAVLARASEVMARGYAGDPAAAAAADRLLDQAGGAVTPHAAYVWHCAGEADLSLGAELTRAAARFERAVELGEATNASFVAGLAGASKASIAARTGDPARAARDYRTLIRHWQRAGMWSTQWTMLRSIAILLDRLGRHEHATVLAAAVSSTQSGHRIFGADEVALGELAGRLRAALGADRYEEASGRGVALDGDAAVEYALRAL